MEIAAVLAELESRGLDGTTLERGEGDRRPGWALRPGATGLELGGWDHDAWCTWRTLGAPDAFGPSGLDELAATLRSLSTSDEPAPFPRTRAETARAATLGRTLMDAAASRAAVDVLPAAEIKVGTPLDHVGDTSGHVLHHYGTSWDERALPDAHRHLPVVGYVLVHNLPLGCRAERVQPAHGLPGGAWRIVLDAPIATYLEAGSLRPFVPKAG